MIREIRRALPIAAVVLLVSNVGGSAQQGTLIQNPVIWKVDHQSRTITATVKLRFYQPRCSTSACFSASAQVIERIKKGIESYWNGHFFKCYKVIFTVDVGLAASQSAVPLDAVDIAIDASATFVSSRTTATDNPGYLSDDPRHRVEVGRSPSDPSTWWVSAPDATYAHEFGHILGLHNNYQDKDETLPKPGAYEDLMFMSQYAGVSAEMITRAVRRSGQVDEAQIRCPMTMDIGPRTVLVPGLEIRNFRIHAYACDYSPPSGDPHRQAAPIRFMGRADYDVTILDPQAILRGRVAWLPGKFTGAVNFAVVPRTQTALTIQVAPEGWQVNARLGWRENHLLIAEGELYISQVPSSEIFFSAVYPIFAHGAEECH